jgi:hypothetical protein
MARGNAVEKNRVNTISTAVAGRKNYQHHINTISTA